MRLLEERKLYQTNSLNINENLNLETVQVPNFENHACKLYFTSVMNKPDVSHLLLSIVTLHATRDVHVSYLFILQAS